MLTSLEDWGSREESRWYLCGSLAAHSPPAVIRVARRLLIGRKPGLDLTISSPYISTQHAELSFVSSKLVVRDLGSRNGTYVNGERIHRATYLGAGDLLRLGDVQLRVETGDGERLPDAPAHLTDLHRDWQRAQLSKLIEDEGIIPVLQPIVALPQGDVVAYEVLARSDVAGLETPARMFAAAKRFGLEVQLSELCRRQGVAAGQRVARAMRLCLNTQPAENIPLELAPSISRLRKAFPELKLVVELSCVAARSVQAMQIFSRSLEDLNIEWTLDNFLPPDLPLLRNIASPPTFVKVGASLTSQLSQRNALELQRLQMLVRSIQMAGSKAVITRVETPEDSRVCALLGFDFAQGNVFGEPLQLPSVPMGNTEAFAIASEVLTPPSIEQTVSAETPDSSPASLLRRGLNTLLAGSAYQKKTTSLKALNDRK